MIFQLTPILEPKWQLFNILINKNDFRPRFESHYSHKYVVCFPTTDNSLDRKCPWSTEVNTIIDLGFPLIIHLPRCELLSVPSVYGICKTMLSSRHYLGTCFNSLSNIHPTTLHDPSILHFTNCKEKAFFKIMFKRVRHYWRIWRDFSRC